MSNGTRRLAIGALAVLSVTVNASTSFQRPTVWRDPSPHKVLFVTVEDGVQLEVLDWGGTGQPIVLLAGYLTAHAYDDFAPKLIGDFHVYGITRRGYGASSAPESGYAAQQSADDVLHVLDSLQLQKPIMAGHSFGGQDITTLGAQHSDRLGGLVYLNSAEDPTKTKYGVEPPDTRKLPATARIAPPRPDYGSFQAYRDWQRRTHGVAFPESELRHSYSENADGSMGRYLPPQYVRDAIFAGRVKPDYDRIRVPVLAFFPDELSEELWTQPFKPGNAEERAALAQQFAFLRAIVTTQIQDLTRGVPTAQVVRLRKSNFYIFLSNDADIVRVLRAFSAQLQKAPSLR